MLALLVVATACAPEPSAPPASPSALDDRALTVASYDFPESTLLARLYGGALAARGYEVRYALGLGPRELVDPALARGLVEMVPEYAGTALAFLSLGAVEPTPDVAATHAALARTLEGSDLAALAAAPAQDANAFVVSRATARRHNLRTISDLQPLASRLTFGGPPECPTRPFCLAGLERVYGIEFRDVVALDAGGPITVQALELGQVDVALLFSTDPALDDGTLVALEDDRHLQPAENITPLLHRSVVEGATGAAIRAAIDAVSARLTTDVLRSLNAQVAAGERQAVVARRWLAAEGLA
jgi:osmoprotectant transport system substrate-binding protein